MPFKFFDLGPRGIVIHNQTKGGASRFTYSLEGDWREREICKPSPELVNLGKGNQLPVALLPGKRVFLNLNTMPMLGKGQEPPGKSTGEKGCEEDHILLYEGERFFSVVAADEPIPDGFEQDAGVLVNRGALCAAIPAGNLPIGTWCVLVNLAQLIRSH